MPTEQVITVNGASLLNGEPITWERLSNAMRVLFPADTPQNDIDIGIAQLRSHGYISVVETDTGIHAKLPSNTWAILLERSAAPL